MRTVYPNQLAFGLYLPAFAESLTDNWRSVTFHAADATCKWGRAALIVGEHTDILQAFKRTYVRLVLRCGKYIDHQRKRRALSKGRLREAL